MMKLRKIPEQALWCIVFGLLVYLFMAIEGFAYYEYTGGQNLFENLTFLGRIAIIIAIVLASFFFEFKRRQ
jgi:hypothetical protein